MKGKNKLKTLVKRKLNESEYNQIYTILLESDKDFVPPLSARYSCNTTNFEENQKESKNIESYINSLFLFPRIFFMKYMKNENQFNSFAVATPREPSHELYINICCVKTDYRHMGLGKNLIFDVINYAKLHNYNKIITRTWSTNKIQLSLLQKIEL